MKSIILFRHGKSNWYANYSKDINRPLNERGIKSAKLMGEYLAKINQIPEKTICSTALRAKRTAELAIRGGNWKSSLEFNKKIYDGSAELLFSIIKRQSSKLNMICLIGHEPCISSFITKSTNSNITKFPTASMARIDFKTNLWNHIVFTNGSLNWLKRPKEIA